MFPTQKTGVAKNFDQLDGVGPFGVDNKPYTDYPNHVVIFFYIYNYVKHQT